MKLVGIDPGLKGGVAIKDGGKIATFPMPLSDGGIDVGTISGIIGPRAVVAIEKVHAMPKQGVCSMFTFGVGFGKLLGMCQVMGYGLHLVDPRTWKRVVLPDTLKDKQAAIDFAIETYGAEKLSKRKGYHDGIADALCILTWLERLMEEVHENYNRKG